MTEILTVGELLRRATGYLAEKGLPSPRLDAEVLLGWVLGTDRVHLYVNYDRPLQPEEVARYRALIGRRAKKVPVAFLRGFKEFYGLPFTVSPAVLIPRPETELLVEQALDWLAGEGARVVRPTGRGLPDLAAAGPESEAVPGAPAAPGPVTTSWAVADVATGSGCIGVALAWCVPEVRVVATDRSTEALEVARANAVRHGVAERVTFLAGDGLAPLREAGWAGRLDLVAANPPYIPSNTVDELGMDVGYEPRSALDGGPDGLCFYRDWLPGMAELLRPGGLVLLEIGYDQGTAVSELARATGAFAEVTVVPDHGGLDRVVRAVRGATP